VRFINWFYRKKAMSRLMLRFIVEDRKLNPTSTN